MSRDVDAAANPDVLVIEDIVEKSLEGGRPPRTPDQARVQADRQHFGRIESPRVPFTVESIEGITRVVEKLRARVESLGCRKAHIVAIERIGHYQVRDGARRAAIAERDFSPVGKIISVGIRIVE